MVHKQDAEVGCVARIPPLVAGWRRSHIHARDKEQAVKHCPDQMLDEGYGAEERVEEKEEEL